MEGAEHTINWIPELVKFLNLAIIVGIIYVFARKGIMSALAARSADISKKIVDAKFELEKMQYEADRAKKEIAEIATIKQKLVDEMREAGLKTYEAMVADAKLAADRIIQDAKLAADNELQTAIGKVKTEIVNQAVSQVLNLVDKSGTEETKNSLHERLIQRFVGNLQENEGNKHGL